VSSNNEGPNKGIHAHNLRDLNPVNPVIEAHSLSNNNNLIQAYGLKHQSTIPDHSNRSVKPSISHAPNNVSTFPSAPQYPNTGPKSEMKPYSRAQGVETEPARQSKSPNAPQDPNNQRKDSFFTSDSRDLPTSPQSKVPPKKSGFYDPSKNNVKPMMEVPDDNSSFSTPFVPNRVRGVPSTFGGFTPSTVPEINITPASVRGYYKDEKKENLSGLS
jgi:hypothetical protein